LNIRLPFLSGQSKPDPLPPVEPEQRLIEQVLPTLVGDVWEALCMARHNLSGKFSHRALIRSVSTLRRIVQKMGQRAGRNESVWSDTFALNVEAQRVIRLRLAAVAQGGPSALPEIRLMVMEKIVALLHATGMLARGGSARAVLLYYRSRVQANERRLSASMNPLHRATQKLLRRVPGIAKRLA
jgi:hypothetical protein